MTEILAISPTVTHREAPSATISFFCWRDKNARTQDTWSRSAATRGSTACRTSRASNQRAALRLFRRLPSMLPLCALQIVASNTSDLFICTFLDVDLRGKQSDDLIRGESHIGHAGQNDIGRVCAGCSVRPRQRRNARRTHGRAPGQYHPEQQP